MMPYKNISLRDQLIGTTRSFVGCKRTVKTARATVPTIKPSELLYSSMNGGFALCCVNDDSHFGRAIVLLYPNVSLLFPLLTEAS